MYSIILLGTGNLATHLFNAFIVQSQVRIVQVYGRNPERLKKFESRVETCSDSTKIKDADVYIIAVKDDAISDVAQLLYSKKGVVVHTSGAMEMDCIPLTNRGVFYPLQTFTKGKPLNFKDIPVCLETSENSSMKLLRYLAEQITNNVHEIDSEQRKKLHLAAVFANNFTNYLYQISKDICEKEGLPFSLLRPLILETAEKIQIMSPFEAQTGPARRGDLGSIQNHISLLENEQQIKIYKLLSKAIQETHEEEL